MKLGFLTNVMVSCGISDLKTIAAWGAENGFADLEVGPTVPLHEEDVAQIREEGRIDLSALIFCRNFLSGDAEQAEEFKKQIIRRIEIAGRYHIPKVLCSTGVAPDSFDGPRFDPHKSLDRSVEFLKVMVAKAEDLGVTLCVENCPLMGNIGFAPFMWDELFSRIDSPNFKLAFDPSHLVWQMMDPYQAVHDYGSRIAHVHAKDTEILWEELPGEMQGHNRNAAEDRAEVNALYAEYAIDFATQAVRHALCAALQALECQNAGCQNDQKGSEPYE